MTLDTLSPDTFSPGPSSPGSEDYVGPASLTISYLGETWVTGTIDQFITEVDNSSDIDAMGTGSGNVASFNPASTGGAGEQFFNEFIAASGGTGDFTFTAFDFQAVSPSRFTSDGTWNVIPEPAHFALIGGLAAVSGLVIVRRRRS